MKIFTNRLIYLFKLIKAKDRRSHHINWMHDKLTVHSYEEDVSSAIWHLSSKPIDEKWRKYTEFEENPQRSKMRLGNVSPGNVSYPVEIINTIS